MEVPKLSSLWAVCKIFIKTKRKYILKKFIKIIEFGGPAGQTSICIWIKIINKLTNKYINEQIKMF